jgi:hypothetical protein
MEGIGVTATLTKADPATNTHQVAGTREQAAGADNAVPLGLVTVVSAALAVTAYAATIRRAAASPRPSVHPYPLR